MGHWNSDSAAWLQKLSPEHSTEKIRFLVVTSSVESFVTVTSLWLLVLLSCADWKEVDDTYYVDVL